MGSKAFKSSHKQLSACPVAMEAGLTGRPWTQTNKGSPGKMRPSILRWSMSHLGPRVTRSLENSISWCLWGCFQMRLDWVKPPAVPHVGGPHPICRGPGFSLPLSDWAGTSVLCPQALVLLVLRTSDSNSISFLWSPFCRSWNLPASINMYSNFLLSIIYLSSSSPPPLSLTYLLPIYLTYHRSIINFIYYLPI